MLSVERHKQFHKDIASLKLSEKHFTKFIVYLAALIQNEPLPQEAHDHELEGEWKGFREFHISGDVLIIYRYDDEVLKLIRMGSHAQLFG
ncbi:MAG: type II toxin-antitoxin system YafQ family toxin [Sulfuricurvum sp.]|nr:type II toxin-antitoxin system YafQ family toxin [Sulfuricurvum sp.]